MCSNIVEPIRLVGLPPTQPVDERQLQRWCSAVDAFGAALRVHYPSSDIAWFIQTGRAASAFFQAFGEDFPGMQPHEVACHRRQGPGKLHGWSMLRYGPFWCDGVEWLDAAGWAGWLLERVASSGPVDLCIDEDGAASRRRLALLFETDPDIPWFIPYVEVAARNALLEAATHPAPGSGRPGRL